MSVVTAIRAARDWTHRNWPNATGPAGPFWTERCARWLRLPGTWFFAATLASLLMGVATGPSGYLLAAVLGGLTAGGCLWPWLALRGLRCTMSFERAGVSEGEPVQLRFRVENRWPIPAWGLNFASGMELQAAGEPAACTVALQAVGGWCVSEFTWELRPELRGVYPRVTPTVCTGFPFALWFACRPVLVERPLLVWPQEVPVQQSPPPVGARAAFQGNVNNRSGQETEVTGLRPYRRGDSLRQVHWPQTARQSTLIVRERPGVSQPRVRIVLDLDPAVHWGRGAAASQEEVFRTARTLVTRLHRARTQLTVQAGWGDGPIWENRLGLRQILDGFARWIPAQSSSPPAVPRTQPGAADCLIWITTGRRGELPTNLPPTVQQIVIAESAPERGGPIRAEPGSAATASGPQPSVLALEPASSLEFAYESFAV